MKFYLSAIILLAYRFISLAQVMDTLATESGLKYIILEDDSGEKADNGKAVEVHYTGMLTDGKIFDSSRERGEPIEFVLGAGQVIKGWDEGIALMSVGDLLRLIIPPDLGYGEKGAGDAIPPNSTLIFDVELMSLGDPKIAIQDKFIEDLFNYGIDSAKANYWSLKKNNFSDYNFKESQLNNLGYEFLRVGQLDNALEILKLNAESFPESANVYDSLAEAYMASGNNEAAIKNYKRSLELDPNNKNAEEMLEKLETKE